MTFQFAEITAPAHWAAYLINDDADGYDNAELEAAAAYFAGWHVLSVSVDQWFSWSADLYGSSSKGDMLTVYTVQKIS